MRRIWIVGRPWQRLERNGGYRAAVRAGNPLTSGRI
jgi:hypothetical protein